MSRWGFVVWWLTAFGWLCSLSGSLRIQQRSVESCGIHPLIALAAARPLARGSLNDVIRAVRADPEIWSEMQILLRRYDDCIRAGDGLHYKRSPSTMDNNNKQQSSLFIVHSPPAEDPIVGSIPEF